MQTQTKDKMIQSITAMLSGIDDIRELERIYRYMQCLHTGSGSAEKESYKDQIVEMVQKMENQDYLFKIYHYILVKFRREYEQETEN